MNIQNNEIIETDNLQKKVYAEQVRLLYSSMSASVAANLITSILFITIQWQTISHDILISWFAASTIVIFLRAILLIAYKRAPSNINDTPKWGNYFLIGSSTTGLILGSAGVLLFPAGEPVNQLACAFVLVGMSSGAMSSLSFGKFNFLIYTVLTLFPLTISLAIENTRLTLILIPMVILSFVFVMRSSATLYRNTYQNIWLRLKSKQKEKELLKSQERHELHIQNTPLGVIEWDTNFKVMAWNKSAEKIFGYSRDEALGQYAKDLIIPTKDLKHVEKIWKHILSSSEGAHSENENTTKYGTRITGEWFNTPLTDDSGKVISVTSLVQDVSERKRIEKMKSEFVSTVSHELRTPLTAIHGSLSIILGGATGDVPQKTIEMLEMADSNTNRLLLLINDILDIKKIEAGELDYDFSKIEIMPLIEQAINENKSYASQYNISFKITERLDKKYINVDTLRFLQTISNILSNAAKFSHSGGKVEIKVFQKQNMARIEVTDHGVGISKEFQPKLFDQFTQQNASNTRKSGGTGLGLSISKTIIEKFSGEINVISEEGKGSTFYIELPLVEES